MNDSFYARKRTHASFEGGTFIVVPARDEFTLFYIEKSNPETVFHHERLLIGQQHGVQTMIFNAGITKTNGLTSPVDDAIVWHQKRRCIAQRPVISWCFIRRSQFPRFSPDGAEMMASGQQKQADQRKQSIAY